MENNNTGFFKTHHNPQRRWMLNNYPVKMLRGTRVEINDNEYNITPGIQKVFIDKSYNIAKSMSDNEKVVFRDILQKTDSYDHIPTKGRMSGRDRYSKKFLGNEVSRMLNLVSRVKSGGIEKLLYLQI